MRSRFRLLPLAVLFLAMISTQCLALNCVQYVRQVSGMDISGDGWQWWRNAGGRFERGHMPKPNAIMVFDRTEAMEHGHVAIVSTVLNARLITINHANWAHSHSLKGHVSTGVLVRDVSDKNDWSEVKVLDESSQAFGRSNRILGFVYNRPGSGGDDLMADNAPETEPVPVKDIDNE
jgi:hypothetical protein